MISFTSIRTTFLAMLIAIHAISIAAYECKIETLDEVAIGHLISLDGQNLEFRSNGLKKAVSLDQLLRVEIQSKSSIGIQSDFGEIKTTSGSTLRIVSFDLHGDNLSVTPLVSTDTELFLPKQDVDAILLPQALSESDWEFWRRACGSNVRTDQLIVRGKSSGSLRSIQGFIESINSEGVKFQLEGDSIAVSWDRLFGVIFYSDSVDNDQRILVDFQEGSHLVVDSTLINENVVELEIGDQMIVLPIGFVRTLDYSSGKIFWLGELPIVKAEWSKRLDVPGFVAFEPRFGESFQGLPLSLLHIDSRLKQVRKKEFYEQGVALRSGSILQVRIPPAGKKFSGLAGIDPLTSRSGKVDLEIRLGQELLLQESIVGETDPLRFEVLLPDYESPGRILTIQVEPTEDGSSGDNLHLVNARITK